MMVEAEKGTMPPFDARDEADCTPRFPIVDDQRLTADEKALFRAWVQGGMERGTEAPVPQPPNTELAGVTHTLQPAEGWATSGNRDQFICYVLDPQLAGPVSWLTGMQVSPEVAAVVHHAVVSQVFAGPEQDQLIAQHGIGKPYDCSEEMDGDDFIVHIWSPGNQPMQTQPDIAIPMLAGSKLVMQVHYHPAGRSYPADRTKVDLRVSSTQPKRAYMVTGFGNIGEAPELLPGPGDEGAPRFVIPRNASDHVERMRIAIPNLGDITDARVFSVNPHMHFVGTHISTKIERPAARGSDPQTECLATGGWNFDWQRTFTYDAPLEELPSLAEGDVIEVTCRWNNTLDNPFVQRMLAEGGLPPQPIDISLGENTTDEMCMQIMGLSIPAPPPETAAAVLSKLMRTRARR
jgi:hypothetical protein